MQYSNSSSAFKPFNPTLLSEMDSRNNETLTEKGSLAFTSSGLVDYNRTETEIDIDGELVAFWNKMIQGLTRESIKD